MKAQIPWLRVFVEGVVIVVSILLAFGLQAWWEGSQERAEETEALAQLLEDFRSNSARLDTTRIAHQRSLAADLELLALTGRGGERAGTNSTTELVRQIGNVATYDPVLGTLNSLIASGRLGILQSDSLRIALAAWPDIVEDLNEGERWRVDEYFDRLAPYLTESGVWLDILVSSGSLRGIDPVLSPPDLSELLRDPLFQEMVGQDIFALQFILDDVETVDEWIQRITRLIEDS